MKHSILLVSFPFGEKIQQKVRPVLCLSEPIGEYEELILAYISSKTTKNIIPSDLIFSQKDEDFSQTGLKEDSVIKLHKLMTLPKSMILRKLGEIPYARKEEISQKLDIILA